jgi:hypothetical protein
MDRRRVISAALALLVLAPPARAQFQPIHMKLAAWPYAELASARWTGGTGPDLLILQGAGTGQARLQPHQDLLGGLASPYASPPLIRSTAIGWFDGDPATTIPDVAWNPSGASTPTFDLAVTWGESPSAFDTFPSVFSHWTDGMAAIHLLPRPQDVLLVTAGKAGVSAVSDLTAVDLASSRGPPAVAPTAQTWSVPAYASAYDGDAYDQIYPLRISPAARTGQVEDAIVPFRQGFFMLWHASVPAGTTLASLDVRAVAFGATSAAGLAPFLPDTLATTFGWGSCLGAAAIDVDDDAVPDLVFSYSDVYWDTYLPPVTGSLLWIRGGDPAAMATQQPWESLMERPELAGVADVGTLRQLALDSGEPAFAFQDRVRERIVIVRGSGATGFTTTELPTPGGYVRELRTLDVVGSPARDLLALVELAPSFTTVEVWVYPDVGDAAPTLGWSPLPPTTAPMGADLRLTVAASDPDAPPLSLRWMGLPGGDVVGTAPDAASVTIPGASLCDATATLSVKVRAMDALGVYVETGPASIALLGQPALRLVGALASGPLVLAPGGVSGRAEGEAWPACATGAPTYAWGELGLTGLVQGSTQPPGSATAWLDFTIPESAYPVALSGARALTLAATGPTATGTVSGTATLPVEIDARGLVAATVAFDETALAQGELGLARIRLASRLGVPLPAVRALVRLEGLSFAGPMTVVGAPATLGPGEGEVVVDPLPPRDATVEILVPVRSGGTPGGVSVELFSGGGYRVSPEASPSAGALANPGCGCGAGGAEGLPILLAAALMMAARRRRPVT